MADDINTLLGLGMNSQDDMKALANSLRNEQAIGDYFSTSTTPEWAKYGQGIQSRTTNAARSGGVLRQAMEKEATRQEELKAEKARLQENYKATALAKTMAATQAHERGQDDINLQNENSQTNDTIKFGRDQLQNQEAERVAVEKAAQLAVDKAAAKKIAADLDYDDFKDYVDGEGNRIQLAQRGGQVFTHDEEGNIQLSSLDGKTPFSDPKKSSGSRGGLYTEFGSPKQQKEFEDLASNSQNQMVVFEQFTPEFGNDTSLPIGGLKNAWTGMGLPSTEGMEKRQEWWKNYNDQYTNIKRHDLFGSALTTGEQEAWKRANVHENSTPDQIAESMATLKYLTRKLATKSKENAIIKKRKPEYIDTNYGWLKNYDDFVDLSVVPEGMNRNEWEELTYGEREEVLKMGIN